MFSAFRFSGRLMVITATAPRRSTRMVSYELLNLSFSYDVCVRVNHICLRFVICRLMSTVSVPSASADGIRLPVKGHPIPSAHADGTDSFCWLASVGVRPVALAAADEITV